MNFTEGFIAARRVSTPLIMVRTPDAASTMKAVNLAITRGKSVSEAEQILETTPRVSWDVINGLMGQNDRGKKEIVNCLSGAGIEPIETIELPKALQAMAEATEDVVLFIKNIHMYWDATTDEGRKVIQGIWNLRDPYKANGNMLIGTAALGATIPNELNNDMLMLEDPLPSRKEIEAIVIAAFKAACGDKFKPTPEILHQAGDALVGIASFPCDQATSMNLDKKTGVLNIAGMWERKKDIISATAGLSFLPTLKLAAAGGLENIKQYLNAWVKGKRGCNLILRLDEIEKMFAGAGTDSSGVTGKLLGNFLSWVVDKKIICMLFVGVPGAAKSHIISCIAGEHDIPALNFDMGAMEDSLVGNSGKNLRAAQATVEAISDGQIMLIATANSLANLAPELISRFEQGGIFFFDSPSVAEQKAILEIKIKQYNLTAAQTKVCPDLTGWTGREINAMCQKADDLGYTLMEAGQYIVPLTKSHHEDMERLRMSASKRFLSASASGLYEYTPPEPKVADVKPVATGRKYRGDEN